MSARPAFMPTPLPLPAPANAGDPGRAPRATEGAILRACPVARGALVLFGWHGARLPRQGQAALEAAGSAVRGAFRLHAWRRDDAGTAWFIAAVQVQEPQLLPAGATVRIEVPGRAGITLGALPSVVAGPEALAETLAAEGGSAPGPIALFVADLAAAAPRVPALRSLLAHFLRRAAEEDGVVEIVGQAGEALMLQGWGRHGAAEPTAVLLGEHAAARAAAAVATFRRGDIAAPATGMVLLLQGAGVDPANLDAVHLASGAVLARRPVLPARKLLGAGDLAGHLRDIAPRLAGDEATMQAVQRLLRPRFTGQETISALDRPLRAAIDLAARFPGVGVYLCGWLADADGAAREVALAGPSGARARLDHAWTRLPRPDVAQAFRTDPRFAGLDPDRPMHGFAAFAADPVLAGDGSGLHLDLALADTACFLPVAGAPGSQRRLVRRVLESLDLHQQGARAAIAAQVGPLLQALLRQGFALPATETLRRAAGTPRRALLLPLPAAGAPPQAALSFLLADPLRPDEGLVMVAPSCWGERELAQLDRALALHGVDATLLRADEPCTWTEALELAARATDAPMLLCLGGSVLGTAPGWREALAAHRAAGKAPGVVFPTALYEDNAVRSVGVAAVEASRGAPWARLRRPRAGMPANSRVGTPGAAIAELLAGSLAGALVSRTAWRAAGGFAGGGLLAEAQEFAFFGRLRDAGERFAHAPQVTVHAPDDAPAGPPPRWQQAAGLADGWLLAAAQATKGAA